MIIAEMIRMIREGIDPSTGEVFDKELISSDPEIRNEICKLAYISSKGSRISKPESLNYLNRNSNAIFESLKAWRLNIAMDLSVPAYAVFTDKELWNIADGDVCSKEDLLFIKGISQTRYDLYGDDLFDIISDYIVEPPLVCSPCDRKIPEITGEAPSVPGNEVRKPARGGESWNEEEDGTLLSEFNEGLTISEIAEKHQRTNGAIQSRLIKHGVIEK